MWDISEHRDALAFCYCVGKKKMYLVVLVVKLYNRQIRAFQSSKACETRIPQRVTFIQMIRVAFSCVLIPFRVYLPAMEHKHIPQTTNFSKSKLDTSLMAWSSFWAGVIQMSRLPSTHIIALLALCWLDFNAFYSYSDSQLRSSYTSP